MTCQEELLVVTRIPKGKVVHTEFGITNMPDKRNLKDSAFIKKELLENPNYLDSFSPISAFDVGLQWYSVDSTTGEISEIQIAGITKRNYFVWMSDVKNL